jgi:hypothetical protein
MHVYDCVTSRDTTPLPVAGEDTTYAPHGEGGGGGRGGGGQTGCRMTTEGWPPTQIPSPYASSRVGAAPESP